MGQKQNRATFYFWHNPVQRITTAKVQQIYFCYGIKRSTELSYSQTLQSYLPALFDSLHYDKYPHHSWSPGACSSSSSVVKYTTAARHSQLPVSIQGIGFTTRSRPRMRNCMFRPAHLHVDLPLNQITLY